MKEGHITINQPLTKEEIREVILDCLKSYQKESHPPHYSKKEFAKLIGKSTSWIDSRRSQGKLKWFRLGGTVCIPHSELVRISHK
jgi:hypothetical protein